MNSVFGLILRPKTVQQANPTLSPCLLIAGKLHETSQALKHPFNLLLKKEKKCIGRSRLISGPRKSPEGVLVRWKIYLFRTPIGFAFTLHRTGTTFEDNKLQNMTSHQWWTVCTSGGASPLKDLGVKISWSF